MPFIRTSPLTGETVLFAPGRSGRPNAFAQTSTRASLNEECPFCPGNEHETPPEIDRAPKSGPWMIRVVPNRYPIVSAESAPQGHHEVIIETPQHATSVVDLSPEHLSEVFSTYARRYAAAIREKNSYVSIFKNEGWGSGQSIEHAHSQLVALNMAPARHLHEVDAFTRFAPQCPVCESLRQHKVISGEYFSVVVPDVPRFAYETWIVPHVHKNDFAGLSEPQSRELALLAREVISRLRKRWDGASFNWSLYNYAPATHAHWRLEIYPRLAGLAGFELTSGMWINVVTPEASAAELRQAN